MDNALKIEYKKMIDNGYDNLFYFETLNALGDDQEEQLTEFILLMLAL